MSVYHRQKMKELLGHADFGPVLMDDVLQINVTGASGVASHTTAGRWTAPRQANIKGITITSTNIPIVGQIEYAISADGAIVASGTLASGTDADAVFLPKDRQNAVIVDAGTVIRADYAVTADLGAATNLRIGVAVSYLGQS